MLPSAPHSLLPQAPFVLPSAASAQQQAYAQLDDKLNAASAVDWSPYAYRPDRATPVQQPAASSADVDEMQADYEDAPPRHAREGQGWRRWRTAASVADAHSDAAAKPSTAGTEHRCRRTSGRCRQQCGRRDQMYQRCVQAAAGRRLRRRRARLQDLRAVSVIRSMCWRATRSTGSAKPAIYARRDYQSAATAFAEGYKVYKTMPQGTGQSAEARRHPVGDGPQTRCLRHLRALQSGLSQGHRPAEAAGRSGETPWATMPGVSARRSEPCVPLMAPFATVRKSSCS